VLALRSLARIAVKLHDRIGEHRTLLGPHRDAPSEPRGRA